MKITNTLFISLMIVFMTGVTSPAGLNDGLAEVHSFAGNADNQNGKKRGETSNEDDALPPNHFLGFETRVLKNGLKVWFKNIPDDPNVYITVTVPFGSDNDPNGKGNLAHFTEHMMFTDHMGRTEEDIKREVQDRGGSCNATTFSDRTSFFVHMPKKDGIFAAEWMYRLISGSNGFCGYRMHLGLGFIDSSEIDAIPYVRTRINHLNLLAASPA